MKILLELIKVLLLSFIALLMTVDMGLLLLPPRLEQLLPVDLRGQKARGSGPVVDATDVVSGADALADDSVEQQLATEQTVASMTASLGSDAVATADAGETGEAAGSGEATESSAEPDAAAAASEPVADEQLVQLVAVDRRHELQKILESRLARRYDFPEHLKFKDTHFAVQQLFADVGVEVGSAQELEFATYCGRYSAPNAAALYGPYRPFFAEVLVNHADQSMDGALWVDIDGDIKKSISFKSDLLISGRKESFAARFNEHCGDSSTVAVGEYGEYETGRLAPYYRSHYAELSDRVADPDFARSLADCVRGGTSLKDCYTQAK